MTAVRRINFSRIPDSHHVVAVPPYRIMLTKGVPMLQHLVTLTPTGSAISLCDRTWHPEQIHRLADALTRSVRICYECRQKAEQGGYVKVWSRSRRRRKLSDGLGGGSDGEVEREPDGRSQVGQLGLLDISLSATAS